MQRYIIVYSTFYCKKVVEVIYARSRYMAMIEIATTNNEVEIKSIRELYNPYFDPNSVITNYELSLLKDGFHNVTNKFNLSLNIYNTIAQIYGDKLLKAHEYGG